jgi:hypothetical protein
MTVSDPPLTQTALTETAGQLHLTAYQRLFASAGNLCCRLFHRSISRPVGGKYRSWKCLREFDLEW